MKIIIQVSDDKTIEIGPIMGISLVYQGKEDFYPDKKDYLSDLKKAYKKLGRLIAKAEKQP